MSLFNNLHNASSTFTSLNSVLSSVKVTNPFTSLMDPTISTKLQPHQVEAFEFVMRRFFPLLDPENKSVSYRHSSTTYTSDDWIVEKEEIISEDEDYDMVDDDGNDKENQKESNNENKKEKKKIKEEEEEMKSKKSKLDGSNNKEDEIPEDFVPLVCTDISLQTGAILADDMGTGKSLVALTVIEAFTRKKKSKAVLVCPSGLLHHWINEAKKFFPKSLGMSATVMHTSSSSTKQQDIQMNRFVTGHYSQFPLLIISYETFRIFSQALSTMHNLDLMVCDEGHRLKNTDGSKTSRELLNSQATYRLLLSGTVAQNNLSEIYSIINFVIPGFLCTKSHFLKKYKKIEDIKEKISPLILRRKKEEILKHILPKRYVFLILIKNNSEKIKINDKLDEESDSSSDLSDILAEDESDDFYNVYYNEINNLYNYIKEKNKRKKKGTQLVKQKKDIENSYIASLTKFRLACSVSSFKPIIPEEFIKNFYTTNSTDVQGALIHLFQVSPKIKVLYHLLQEIIKDGKEKIIISSNYTESLDQVKNLIKLMKWNSLRIDGSVNPDARDKIVSFFNSSSRSSSSFHILLLSARAGGVGLNLTEASHLVLLDPDWNPATDAQVMGRIYRQGQTRQVYIYRLIMQDTIEDSIIRKQILKSKLEKIVDNESDNQIDEAKLNYKENKSALHDKTSSLDFSSTFKELVHPSTSSFSFHTNYDNDNKNQDEFEYKNYSRLPLPQTNKPFKKFYNEIKDDIDILTLCD